jgi:hypothetical protein
VRARCGGATKESTQLRSMQAIGRESTLRIIAPGANQSRRCCGGSLWVSNEAIAVGRTRQRLVDDRRACGDGERRGGRHRGRDDRR